jgi:cytochrome c oxidase subunit IV
MKINRDNLKWCARLLSIVFLIALADALVVIFMRRPFPFTVLIPCSIPILVAVFVIIPMSRAHRT